MWSRLTGTSAASQSSKDDDARRRRTSDSTRSKRDPDTRSVVSSTSTRKPPTSRRDTAPSSTASFTTALDDMPRSRAPANADDPYAAAAADRYDKRRDDRRSSYAESSTSTMRDDKDKKKKTKDSKTEKRRSTRSERSGSLSQSSSGYRGDIVDSPKQVQRSFSGQIGSDGFSQFPGQAGAPMMSGALPAGSNGLPLSSSQPQQQQQHYHHSEGLSSHVQSQFPGQDPVHFASGALPGGHPFGAAAEFYNDQGQSVSQQPGVRPQPPSVIVGQDTPHLMAASAHANPAADTGSGAAADFYAQGASSGSSSKPPRPSTSSMPGAFVDDSPAPPKPPRPASSSRPDKPTKYGSAAAMASGAALGLAMGNSSSSHEHSTSYSSSSNVRPPSSYSSYTNNTPAPAVPASTYNMYGNAPNTSNSTASNGTHLPSYNEAAYGGEGVPPPKPPRPGKHEKHSSSSNAGLYAAGAAGLAAYGLHQHNSHSHSHSHTHSHSHSTSQHHSTHGTSNTHSNNGLLPSAYVSGGMAQHHQHTGPVSRFVDWWKDYEDVQKMEEYTEYIGVCKGCFDPRSSVLDAPRKHHYYKRRSNEYMRTSGGIEKQSRYNLKEKKSQSSISGEDRRKTSNSAAGWVAAGLGGIGLAKAGKAVWNAARDDFDDTYSIKSGRSHVSRRSRSRSLDRKSYSYGHSGIRHRSRSADRMSQMSIGVTGDRKDRRDHKSRRHSRASSSSSSSSGHGKSGLIGAAIGAGLAGAALGATSSKKRHARSKSPKKVQVVHPRRDSNDDDRSRRSHQLRHKASRSSTSGASVIEIGQHDQHEGGFFQGFFAAPPPKEKRPKPASLKKKKKGFFTFSNDSTSSSNSEMAFGTGYVRRRRRSSHSRRPSPKRRNSDERLKASLIGLGATAAAITAAKAGKGKRSSREVVAVKESRHNLKGNQASHADDEWEDLPDDGTSDSASDGGLVYGDYALKKSKSNDSLGSNDSGTNKWGWRWGFGKKKRRSSNNLYDNIANTSFIGPAAAGAAGAVAGAAAAGSAQARPDSESSSAQTLQSVYPVAPHDPNAFFDARRTSSIATSQPLVTSGPGSISLQQPQPMPQVPGTVYSAQSSSQSGYNAHTGPSVFSQAPPQPPYQTQSQATNVIINNQLPQQPPLRRANSSPIQTSSWRRDAAIAGLAATAGAAAISAMRQPDRPPSASSNVRFNLTQAQADKEMRERRKQQERLEEEAQHRREQQRLEDEARWEEEELARREHQRREDQARRAEAARRDEEERVRREQQRQEDEARKVEEDRRLTLLRLEETRREEEERRLTLLRLEEAKREEDERRRRELERQQEEARKFIEIERLARLENDRRREQQELEARRRREAEEEHERQAQLRREAEERERRERAAFLEHQHQLAIEAAEERQRRELREAQQQEFDRREAVRREAEMQDDLERRRRDRESQDSKSRYSSDQARKLDEQSTASSIASAATVVPRKEKELQDREREVSKPERKSSVASAVAAGAAAAITAAAISSYKDKTKEKEKEREKEKEKDRKRDRSLKRQSSSSSKSSDSKRGKTRESANVKTIEPSRVEQDMFDEDIFNPDLFKESSRQNAREVLQDWEDRYSAKPVSQAEFFAPRELLADDNLPKVKPVDPNEGVGDLQTYYAHEDHPSGQPMVPPYPPSYSFTATRDGRPTKQQPLPIPILSLTMPTPPGSRTPSVRSVSPSPVRAREPVKEPARETKDETRQDDSNRARSRVSWGENQFHHFDVPTPESFREQFVSDGDLKKQEPKPSSEQVTTERELPQSSQATSSYLPYRPGISLPHEPRQTIPSTQYASDDNSSTWDSTVSASSKASERHEEKESRPTSASSVSPSAPFPPQEHQDEYDYRRINASILSNPFSDTHMAPSTIAASTISTPSIISAAPSTSSVQTAYYQPEPSYDVRMMPERRTTGPGFVEGEVADEHEPLHIPGSFEEAEASEPPTPTKESFAAAEKKGKSSKSTDENVVLQDVSRRTEPESPTVSKSSKGKGIESDAKSSKKDKEKDKEKKKKKSKSSKRASVDTWEMSEPSPPTSPVVERDPRDIEPSRTFEPSRSGESSQSAERGQDYQSSKSVPSKDESSSSKASTAALTGGFAALLGTAMSQDQDRMASDLERARRSLESAGKHTAHDSHSSPSSGNHASEEHERNVTIPSYAFEGVEELADKTPRRKGEKRNSSGGKWSPSVGSPLRTEMKQEDYIGAQGTSDPKYQPLVEAPKVPTAAPFTNTSGPTTSRSVADSGYYAPDDFPHTEPTEKESDKSYFSSSHGKNGDTQSRDSTTGRSRRSDDEDDYRLRSPYDDDDIGSIASLSYKYEDPDREERRRRRREAKSETRDKSRDRSHSRSRDRDYDVGEGEERRRKHRRRKTDEGVDDWDTRSTYSEARSDANGERRRRHKRKESSPEAKTRSRSTAASEQGDFYDEPKSSRRRSKYDDDDSVSLISSFAGWDDDRSSRKEKEKRTSGLSGLFSSKSRENLAEAASKSSRSRDDDDEERKHRRRKHRSDRGSTYGSDDDDARSTISSSSRREKRSRSSRSERGHGDRADAYDEKDRSQARAPAPHADEPPEQQQQSFLDHRAVAAATPRPLPASDPVDQVHESSGIIPGGRAEIRLPTLDNAQRLTASDLTERPTTPPPELSLEDSRALLTRLTGLQPWLLEAFPDELPPLPLSRPSSPTRSPDVASPASTFSQRRLSSSTAVPIRFRKPSAPPAVHRDLIADSNLVTSPLSEPSPTRSRHSKSHSTEFKSTREFRPLYLVERNRKSGEIEEALPPLPPSTTPSVASGTESEGEYESALESPHESAGLLSNDPSFDPLSAVSDLISPSYGSESQQPELAPRDIEEAQESGQATPKASDYFTGEPAARRQSGGPNFDTLTAALEEAKAEERDESTDDAFVSTVTSPDFATPLEQSAPLDDRMMRDVSDVRSGPSSSTSSRLQDAALGAAVGGLAAAALHDRFSSDSQAKSKDAPKEIKPVVEDKQLEPESTQQAVAEPEVKLRSRKGKDDDKSKRFSLAESTASTLVEDRGESSKRSPYIPTFVENEDDWNKNTAESIVTDNATLVGEPSDSTFEAKERFRQKVLDNTAPQEKQDPEIRRAVFDVPQDTTSREIETAEKSTLEREDLQTDVTPETPQAEREPVAADVAEPELAAAEQETPVTTPKAKKTKKEKKSKKGKRANKQVVEPESQPEPSALPETPVQEDGKEKEVTPAEAQKDVIEREILQPAFESVDKQEKSDVLETVTPAPVEDVKSETVAPTPFDSEPKLENIVPAAVEEPKQDTVASEPADNDTKPDIPVKPFSRSAQSIVQERPSTAETTETPKAFAEESRRASTIEGSSSSTSGWGSSLWGKIGWGGSKKKAPSSLASASPPSSPKPQSAVLAALAAAREEKRKSQTFSPTTTIDEEKPAKTTPEVEVQDVQPKPQEVKAVTPRNAVFTDDGKPSFSFPDMPKATTATTVERVEPVVVEKNEAIAKEEPAAAVFVPPKSSFFTDGGKPAFSFPTMAAKSAEESKPIDKEVVLEDVASGEKKTVEAPAFVAPRSAFFTDDGKPSFTLPAAAPTASTEEKTKEAPVFVAPKSAFFTDDGRPSFSLPSSSLFKPSEPTASTEPTVEVPTEETVLRDAVPADTEKKAKKGKKSKKAKKAEQEAIEIETPSIIEAPAPAVERALDVPVSEPVSVPEVEPTTAAEEFKPTPETTIASEALSSLPIDEATTKDEIVVAPEDTAAPSVAEAPVKTKKEKKSKKSKRQSGVSTPVLEPEASSTPAAISVPAGVPRDAEQSSAKGDIAEVDPANVALPVPKADEDELIELLEPRAAKEVESIQEPQPEIEEITQVDPASIPLPVREEDELLEPLETQAREEVLPVKETQLEDVPAEKVVAPEVEPVTTPKVKKSKKSKRKSGLVTPQVETEEVAQVDPASVPLPVQQADDELVEPTPEPQPVIEQLTAVDPASVPLPMQRADDDLVEPLETPTAKEVESQPEPEKIAEVETVATPKGKKSKKSKRKSGVVTPQVEDEVVAESIAEPVVQVEAGQTRDVSLDKGLGDGFDAAAVPLPEDKVDDELFASPELRAEKASPAELIAEDIAVTPVPKEEPTVVEPPVESTIEAKDVVSPPVEPVQLEQQAGPEPSQAPEASLVDVEEAASSKKDKKRKKSKKEKALIKEPSTPTSEVLADVPPVEQKPEQAETERSIDNVESIRDVGPQGPQPLPADNEAPPTIDSIPEPPQQATPLPEEPSTPSKKSKKKKGKKSKAEDDVPTTPTAELSRELEPVAEPTPASEPSVPAPEQIAHAEPALEAIPEPIASISPKSSAAAPVLSEEVVPEPVLVPVEHSEEPLAALEEELATPSKKSKKKKKAAKKDEAGDAKPEEEEAVKVETTMPAAELVALPEGDDRDLEEPAREEKVETVEDEIVQRAAEQVVLPLTDDRDLEEPVAELVALPEGDDKDLVEPVQVESTVPPAELVALPEGDDKDLEEHIELVTEEPFQAAAERVALPEGDDKDLEEVAPTPQVEAPREYPLVPEADVNASDAQAEPTQDTSTPVVPVAPVVEADPTEPASKKSKKKKGKKGKSMDTTTEPSTPVTEEPAPRFDNVTEPAKDESIVDETAASSSRDMPSATFDAEPSSAKLAEVEGPEASSEDKKGKIVQDAGVEERSLPALGDLSREIPDVSATDSVVRESPLEIKPDEKATFEAHPEQLAPQESSSAEAGPHPEPSSSEIPAEADASTTVPLPESPKLEASTGADEVVTTPKKGKKKRKDKKSESTSEGQPLVIDSANASSENTDTLQPSVASTEQPIPQETVSEPTFESLDNAGEEVVPEQTLSVPVAPEQGPQETREVAEVEPVAQDSVVDKVTEEAAAPLSKKDKKKAKKAKKAAEAEAAAAASVEEPVASSALDAPRQDPVTEAHRDVVEMPDLQSAPVDTTDREAVLPIVTSSHIDDTLPVAPKAENETVVAEQPEAESREADKEMQESITDVPEQIEELQDRSNVPAPASDGVEEKQTASETPAEIDVATAIELPESVPGTPVVEEVSFPEHETSAPVVTSEPAVEVQPAEKSLAIEEPATEQQPVQEPLEEPASPVSKKDKKKAKKAKRVSIAEEATPVSVEEKPQPVVDEQAVSTPVPTEAISEPSEADVSAPAMPALVEEQEHEAAPIQEPAQPEAVAEETATMSKKDKKKAKKAKRASIAESENMSSIPTDEPSKELAEETKEVPSVASEPVTPATVSETEKQDNTMTPSEEPSSAAPVVEEPVVQAVEEETAPMSKKDKKKAKKAAKRASTVEAEASEPSATVEQPVEESKDVFVSEMQPPTPSVQEEIATAAPSDEQVPLAVPGEPLTSADETLERNLDAPEAPTEAGIKDEEPTFISKEEAPMEQEQPTNAASLPEPAAEIPSSSTPTRLDSGVATPSTQAREEDEAEPAEWAGLSKSAKKKLKKAKRASLAASEPSQPEASVERALNEPSAAEQSTIPPATDEPVTEKESVQEQPQPSTSTDAPTSGPSSTEEQAMTGAAPDEPANDDKPPDKQPDEPPPSSKKDKKKAKKQAKKNESFLADETSEAANSDTQPSLSIPTLSETQLPFSEIPPSYLQPFADELVDTGVVMKEESGDMERSGEKVEGELQEKPEETNKDVVVEPSEQEPVAVKEEVVEPNVDDVTEKAKEESAGEQAAASASHQEPTPEDAELSTVEKGPEIEKQEPVVKEPASEMPTAIAVPDPLITEPTPTVEVEPATSEEASVLPRVSQDEPTVAVDVSTPAAARQLQEETKEASDEATTVPIVQPVEAVAEVKDEASSSSKKKKKKDKKSKRASTVDELVQETSVPEPERDVVPHEQPGKDTVAPEPEKSLVSEVEDVKPIENVARTESEIVQPSEPEAADKPVETTVTSEVAEEKTPVVVKEDLTDAATQPETATPIPDPISEVTIVDPAPEVADRSIDNVEISDPVPAETQQLPEPIVEEPTSPKKSKKKSKKAKQQAQSVALVETIPEVHTPEPQAEASVQLEPSLQNEELVNQPQSSREIVGEVVPEQSQKVEDVEPTVSAPLEAAPDMQPVPVEHEHPLPTSDETVRFSTPIADVSVPTESREVVSEQPEPIQPVLETPTEPQTPIEELAEPVLSKKDKKKAKKAKKQAEAVIPVVLPNVEQKPEEVQLAAVEDVAEASNTVESKPEPETTSEPAQVASEVALPEESVTDTPAEAIGDRLVPEPAPESASEAVPVNTIEAEELSTPTAEPETPLNAAPLSKKDKKKAKKAKSKALETTAPEIESEPTPRVEEPRERGPTEASEKAVLSEAAAVPLPQEEPVTEAVRDDGSLMVSIPASSSDHLTSHTEDVPVVLLDTAPEPVVEQPSEVAQPEVVLTDVPQEASAVEEARVSDTVMDAVRDVPQQEVVEESRQIEPEQVVVPLEEPGSPSVSKKKNKKKAETVTPVVEAAPEAESAVVATPTVDEAPSTVTEQGPVASAVDEQPTVQDLDVPQEVVIAPEETVPTPVAELERVLSEQSPAPTQTETTLAQDVNQEAPVEEPVLDRKLSKKEKKKAKKQAAALSSEPIVESDPVVKPVAAPATESSAVASVDEPTVTEDVQQTALEEPSAVQDPLPVPEAKEDVLERVIESEPAVKSIAEPATEPNVVPSVNEPVVAEQAQQPSLSEQFTVHDSSSAPEAKRDVSKRTIESSVEPQSQDLDWEDAAALAPKKSKKAKKDKKRKTETVTLDVPEDSAAKPSDFPEPTQAPEALEVEPKIDEPELQPSTTLPEQTSAIPVLDEQPKETEADLLQPEQPHPTAIEAPTQPEQPEQLAPSVEAELPALPESTPMEDVQLRDYVVPESLGQSSAPPVIDSVEEPLPQEHIPTAIPAEEIITGPPQSTEAEPVPVPSTSEAAEPTSELQPPVDIPGHETEVVLDSSPAKEDIKETLSSSSYLERLREDFGSS